MCYEAVALCMHGTSFVRILSNTCRESSECCVSLTGTFLSAYLASFRSRTSKNSFTFTNKKMETKTLIYSKHWLQAIDTGDYLQTQMWHLKKMKVN